MTIKRALGKRTARDKMYIQCEFCKYKILRYPAGGSNKASWQVMEVHENMRHSLEVKKRDRKVEREYHASKL